MASRLPGGSGFHSGNIRGRELDLPLGGKTTSSAASSARSLVSTVSDSVPPPRHKAENERPQHMQLMMFMLNRSPFSNSGSFAMIFFVLSFAVFRIALRF